MGYGIASHLRGYRQYQYLRGAHTLGDAVDASKPLIRYIGWLGQRNIGDEALFLAYRRALFPGCIVTPYYDLSVGTVLARMKRRKYVALGGGTLINDDSYLRPLEQAQRGGYATFVFGTGVGDLAYWSQYPEHHRGNSQRWLAALAQCRYVGVRGPRSLKWLHDNGLTQAEMIGDAALALEPPSIVGKDTTQPRIGINLGSHDPVSGGLDPLFEAVVAFVQRALRRGYAVSYVSMHSIDHALGVRLQDRIRDAGFRLEPLTDDVDVALQQLGRCDYVISQRLHGTVLACVLGVPNVSLSYQPKCFDFLESIGRADIALPTEGIDVESLQARFDTLERDASAVKDRLLAACDALRQRQRTAATGLLQTLDRE
jgi:polysaccharide pyruvyl transferase WcaK-like protein